MPQAIGRPGFCDDRHCGLFRREYPWRWFNIPRYSLALHTGCHCETGHSPTRAQLCAEIGDGIYSRDPPVRACLLKLIKLG
jgi:hypothetical protein